MVCVAVATVGNAVGVVDVVAANTAVIFPVDVVVTAAGDDAAVFANVCCDEALSFAIGQTAIVGA